jgi:hypothetical protein
MVVTMSFGHVLHRFRIGVSVPPLMLKQKCAKMTEGFAAFTNADGNQVLRNDFIACLYDDEHQLQEVLQVLYEIIGVKTVSGTCKYKVGEIEYDFSYPGHVVFEVGDEKCVLEQRTFTKDKHQFMERLLDGTLDRHGCVLHRRFSAREETKKALFKRGDEWIRLLGLKLVDKK